MYLREQAPIGIDTRERIVFSGKASTAPHRVEDTAKPTVMLFMERPIPEARKSERHQVIFQGPSSNFVLNSIRLGQEMTVHGFYRTVMVKAGLRGYPMRFIEATQLELDDLLPAK